MQNDNWYRVPVTKELRSHIESLKNQNGNLSWRALQGKIPGWRWSYGMLADLVNGRQESTSIDVYKVLGLKPPLFIFAGPGSIIIGSGQGLLSPDQAVVYIAIPPEEWKRHSMECAICGETCARWSSTQKYCDKHSWATLEGRRFQRKAKAHI